jgi:hypothetical protein
MPEPGWNVVATVYDREFRDAKSRLSRFGDVRASVYRNVLLMKVADIDGFLERLERSLDEDASLAPAVSRVVPVTRFHVHDAGELCSSPSVSRINCRPQECLSPSESAV